jgi:hypothetical protein
MVKRETAMTIRKVHRYLGLFIGIQFLLWTISGIYFSWTDLDEIHGDQFRKPSVALSSFEGLNSPSLPGGEKIRTLVLRQIGEEPYYFINGEFLINARTGKMLQEISAGQARQVAALHMADDLSVLEVEKIYELGKHHEYRGRPLPAYVIHYDHPQNLKAYISANDGSFQSVRHRSWRWFDFLWMTHTMDYEGRDNFNTMVLRVFSFMGLITVLSGFTLWFVTSPRLRRINKQAKSKFQSQK